jgi:histone H3/H4
MHKHTRKQRVTDASVRRLARRVGVARMSKTVYGASRAVIAAVMFEMVRGATVYAQHNRRKTVAVANVTCASKRMGYTLYGYDE